ncbi:MAG TPA: RNA pseudouridine synthase [Lysobacter sp.]|nr:RNA pseudouridine synthase [Lysobacter sp.]
MTEPVRLAQRVAQLLDCSRNEAEHYIRNGRVSVDGRIVELPQHRVADERIEIETGAPPGEVEPATILLNKPAGFDAIEGARPALALVTPESRWADDPSGVRLLQRHFHRLVPLVPLERDASGLMVLTQDRRVRRRLVEDADDIEHEYLVEVDGEMAPDGLARLRDGLPHRGGLLPRCSASWQSENRLRFAIKGVRDGQLQWMCAQVGLRAVSIRRLRIGRIATGKGPNGAMPPGAWRYLPVGERF